MAHTCACRSGPIGRTGRLRHTFSNPEHLIRKAKLLQTHSDAQHPKPSTSFQSREPPPIAEQLCNPPFRRKHRISRYSSCPTRKARSLSPSPSSLSLVRPLSCCFENKISPLFPFSRGKSGLILEVTEANNDGFL